MKSIFNYNIFRNLRRYLIPLRSIFADLALCCPPDMFSEPVMEVCSLLHLFNDKD